MNRLLTTILLVVVCAAASADGLSFAEGGSLALASNGQVIMPWSAPAPAAGAWKNATMTAQDAPAPNEIFDAYGTPMYSTWMWFDHDTDTTATYTATPVTGECVIYDFGATGTVVDELRVTQVPGYGVASYTFAGSDDNLSYTTIGTNLVSDDATEQTFEHTNTTGYRYYRFTFSAVYDGGGTKVQFYEIKLYGPE
jgi:hypothetical protein